MGADSSLKIELRNDFFLISDGTHSVQVLDNVGQPVSLVSGPSFTVEDSKFKSVTLGFFPASKDSQYTVKVIGFKNLGKARPIDFDILTTIADSTGDAVSTGTILAPGSSVLTAADLTGMTVTRTNELVNDPTDFVIAFDHPVSVETGALMSLSLPKTQLQIPSSITCNGGFTCTIAS